MKLKPTALAALLGLLIGVSLGCRIPVQVRSVPTVPLLPTSTRELTATPLPYLSPVPTEILIKQSDTDIMGGIQHSLNLYAQAYNKNRLELLTQAVDQTNLPFRRLVKTQFDSYQKSIDAGHYTFQYNVKNISRMKFGFVLAHLSLGSSPAAADWLFRLVDGRWVLSEPTLAQVGTMKEVSGKHFVFETYPWSADVNADVIQQMDNAAARVEKKLGKLPDQKARVIIKPIYGIDPFDDPNAVASYTPGSNGVDDTIKIFAPHSYTFGFYSTQADWQIELANTLTHEYTHMVHQRAFDNVGRLMDWFGEGLAEYVSDSQRIYEVRDALRQNKLIPILDSSRTVDKQDLMHLYLLNADKSLAYAESQSLVKYIADTYGGLDAVWKLARADDKSQDFDKALQQSFNISYSQFDQNWRAWLAKNY